MKKRDCLQRHHIQYEPEVVVTVRRSEHFFITRLSYFKELTAGAKKAIRYIVRTKPTRSIKAPPHHHVEVSPGASTLKKSMTKQKYHAQIPPD